MKLKPLLDTLLLVSRNPGSLTVRLLGLWLHFGWAGNCTTPAIHLQVLKTKFRGPYPSTTGHPIDPAKITLTFRNSLLGKVSKHTETTFYLRCSGRLDWNSEHLAVLFGEPEDAPHGTCYFIRSKWLGYHAYV